MGAIFDIIVIAILALSIFFAARQGFVRSVISLLGGLISLILASIFGSRVGEIFSDLFIEKFVRGYIVNAFAGIMNVNTQGSTEQVLRNTDLASLVKDMPQILKDTLKMFNVDPDTFSNLAKDLEKSTTSSMGSFKDSMINFISEPIVSAFSYVLGFIAVFAICLILFAVVGLFSGLIIEKIPGLGAFNTIGGVIIGLIRAVLIICVICVIVIKLTSVYSGQPDTIFSNNTINQTFIFKMFYNATDVFIN